MITKENVLIICYDLEFRIRIWNILIFNAILHELKAKQTICIYTFEIHNIVYWNAYLGVTNV